MTDNIDYLARFVVIGDTPVQAFFEKVVGYLVGSILVFSGMQKMFPVFQQLDVSEKQLRHQVHHHRLTGLPNRHSLFAQLSQIKKEDNRGVLLYLKINDFSTIHESMGPTITDKFILCFTKRLKTYENDKLRLFHLAGPDFAVLVSDEENKENVYEIVRQIDEIMLAPILTGDHELHCALRIGASLCSKAGNADDVVKHTATAQFKTQQSGANGLLFFIPEMQDEVDNRLQLMNQLGNAVINNEFCVYFQPKTDINNNIVSAEALVRWIQPGRGLIPPDQFIPIAEESGIINDIGRWVMTEVCKKIKQWSQEKLLNEKYPISVNVSVKEMRQPDFVQGVEAILKETGINPEQLCIELTESVLLDDADGSIQKMEQFKKLGIKLSIDDFGTGYSSLSYLSDLYVDELKIDRCFVKEVSNNPQDTVVVDAIINIAKNLKLDIVVEGVETDQQVNYFYEKQCHVFQGYYFSRPLPADEFYQRLIDQAAGK